MTRHEAIRAMQNDGAKVTHKYFDDDEWMTINESEKIVFEDDCSCTQKDFWATRTDEEWQQDWSIYET